MCSTGTLRRRSLSYRAENTAAIRSTGKHRSTISVSFRACLITHPEMGASDVVFMMIMLASFTSFAKNEIPLSFILVFILYIGGQFFNFGTLQHNGISVAAHIAGGLCGSLFAFLLTPQNFPAGAQDENSAKQNASERTQSDTSEPAGKRDVKIGTKKSALKKHTKGEKKR